MIVKNTGSWGEIFKWGDNLNHRNVNFLKWQKATRSETEHLIDRRESAQKLWEFDRSNLGSFGPLFLQILKYFLPLLSPFSGTTLCIYWCVWWWSPRSLDSVNFSWFSFLCSSNWAISFFKVSLYVKWIIFSICIITI